MKFGIKTLQNAYNPLCVTCYFFFFFIYWRCYTLFMDSCNKRFWWGKRSHSHNANESWSSQNFVLFEWNSDCFLNCGFKWNSSIPFCWMDLEKKAFQPVQHKKAHANPNDFVVRWPPHTVYHYWTKQKKTAYGRIEQKKKQISEITHYESIEWAEYENPF